MERRGRFPSREALEYYGKIRVAPIANAYGVNRP
jgi:hypothetical protein